jgi:hypothetical protein
MTCWPYPIDWAATGSFWSGIGTLGLATLAVYATTEWKRQYKETRINEAAVSALASIQEIYALLDRIQRTAAMFIDKPNALLETLTNDDAMKLSVVCSISDRESERLKSKIESVLEAGYFLNATFGDEFKSLIDFSNAAADQIENLERLVHFVDIQMEHDPHQDEYEFSKTFAEILQMSVLSAPNHSKLRLEHLRSNSEMLLKQKISIYK